MTAISTLIPTIQSQLTSTRSLHYAATSQPWSAARKETIRELEKQIYQLEKQLITAIKEGQVWRHSHSRNLVVITWRYGFRVVYKLKDKGEKVCIIDSSFVRFFELVEKKEQPQNVIS
jgi:ribulose kinase